MNKPKQSTSEFAMTKQKWYLRGRKIFSEGIVQEPFLLSLKATIYINKIYEKWNE